MCKTLTLYESDIEELSPHGLDRVRGLLYDVQDALSMSQEIADKKKANIGCIAGVIAPTGIGKSTFLATLAVASVLREDSRVTIITPTKESRAEVLARLLEIMSKIKQKGETPPRVLIVYSKFDTCISTHKKIKEIRDAIREEEEKQEPDRDVINKLAKLFYNRCNQLTRNHKCIYYENSKESSIIEKIKKTILSDSYVYIVGSITDETRKIIQQEAPSYVKLSEEIGVDLPFVSDMKKIAEVYKVCPYELAKALVEDVDIIVLDNVYLSSVFAEKKNPIVREALSPERLLLVDETHELFKNIYPSIKISPESPIYKLPAIKELPSIIDGIITRYSVPEAKIDSEDLKVRIAVPEHTLPSQEVDLLLEKVAEAEEELDTVKLSKKERLIVESELAMLEEALKYEKAGYRVSETANPGILAFMKVSQDDREEYYIVPVMFTRKLIRNRDYHTAIHFSATLLPTHISLLHRVNSKLAGSIIVPFKWDVIEKKRRTAIVKVPAYYNYRQDVVELIKKIIQASGKEKILIIASTTWSELIRETSKELGYSYHIPRQVYTQEEREGEANKIRELLHAPGKLVLHISPHTSLGVAVNLADKEKPLDTLIIAASESILPPSSEINAESSVVARKYGIGWYRAWFVTNVNRSILKTIQTAGRVQRSDKHTVDLILIGRYFDRTLGKFYEPVFGKYDIVYEGDHGNHDEIVESIKQYMGWK